MSKKAKITPFKRKNDNAKKASDKSFDFTDDGAKSELQLATEQWFKETFGVAEVRIITPDEGASLNDKFEFMSVVEMTDTGGHRGTFWMGACKPKA